MNLPGRVISELNRAYCVALKLRLVRLDIKAISATLANPPNRLSALITAASQASDTQRTCSGSTGTSVTGE